MKSLKANRLPYKIIGRFLSLFVLFLSVGIVAIHFLETTVLVNYLCESYALMTSMALKSLGFIANSQGKTVQLAPFAMVVVPECTGLHPWVLFCAAAISFPAPLRKKGVAVVVSIPFFYLLNVFRLMLLAIFGKTDSAWFDIFHQYIWQYLFIIIVFSVWIFWIKWALGGDKNQ